jgi:hypothetical protein
VACAHAAITSLSLRHLAITWRFAEPPGAMLGPYLAGGDREAAMSDDEAAQLAARKRRAAEHRAIMQATLQAKRSGKLPKPQGSAAGDAVTAVVVIGVVVGVLALAFRYGG